MQTQFKVCGIITAALAVLPVIIWRSAPIVDQPLSLVWIFATIGAIPLAVLAAGFGIAVAFSKKQNMLKALIICLSLAAMGSAAIIGLCLNLSDDYSNYYSTSMAVAATVAFLVALVTLGKAVRTSKITDNHR